MKAVCILTLAFAAFFPFATAVAQAPEYDWARAGIAASASANPRKIVADANGNVYIAGHFGNTLTLGSTTLVSAGPPSADVFVAKLDSAGNFVWARQFGYSGTDYCNAMGIDGAGNIYLAGRFSDSIRFDNILLYNGKFSGIYVAKLSPAGQTLWAECSTTPFNATVYEEARALAVNPDGSFFMGGSFGTDSLTFQHIKIAKRQPVGGQGLSNGFVVKYSSAGLVEWGIGEGVGTSPGFNEVSSLAADNAGNVFVGGKFGSNRIVLGADTLVPTFEEDVFFGKINAAGNYEWVRQIWGIAGPGATYETVTGMATDGSHLYIAGNYMGTGVAVDSMGLSYPNALTPSGLTNPYVFKLDSSGGLIWGKAFGNTSCGDRLSSLQLVPGQGLLMSGLHRTGFQLDTISVPGAAACTADEGFLALLSPNGHTQWVKTVSGPNHDSFRDAVVAGQKIYAAGVFGSPTASFGSLSLTGNPGSSFNNVFVSRLSFPQPNAAPELQSGLITVYPNPAHNLLQVNTPEPVTRCVAYASTGQQLELAVAPGNLVQLHSLAPGLYTLHFYLPNGQVRAARVVKQ